VRPPRHFRLRSRIQAGTLLQPLSALFPEAEAMWSSRDGPLRADTVAKLVDVEICDLIVRPQQESHFVWRDYARGLSDIPIPSALESHVGRGFLGDLGEGSGRA
jgi:hypothetical protein